MLLSNQATSESKSGIAEAQAVPANTAKPERNQSIELLRIVASFGVVAYHSLAAFQDVALAGLMVFLTLTPYMNSHYNFERRRPVQALARRYLIPWVFWFLIYGAANVVFHKPFLKSGFWFSGILYGTSGHLWFLPAMFMFLVALNTIRDKPITLIYNASAFAASLMFVTIPLWRVASLDLPLPLPQWIHAIPVMCVGIVLGLFTKIPKNQSYSIIAVVLSLAAALAYRVPSTGIPYFLGVFSVGIVVCSPAKIFPTKWKIETFSELAMGIYLTHVFWLYIFSAITGPSNYLTVILCFTASAATTYAARIFIPHSKILLG